MSDNKIGHDVHRELATKLFGVRYEDVTEEQRKAAKIANYRILYRGAEVAEPEQRDDQLPKA
jgi:DNA polymerase I-like protein with 3'-5' exonuclease and polymerase domains